MRSLVITFIVCCSALSAYSQDVIQGIVVDSATFEPLPYVSVQIKNKTKGTITDGQGNFSLFATELDTLIFSLVGYARLELPLIGYEAGLIRMAERATILKSITIHDSRVSPNPYEGMFENPTERLKAGIPFWYSKARKDKIQAGRWREENIRVKTYVDVVINNPETKAGLMKKHGLTESQYYTTLTKFNETHYNVMYYLTEAELISFLNRFFESQY